MTCSSFSPKSNPKSVHSLLCSIAGSPSSYSSSPNCSFPRELTSVYATYLRSHFSVSQPKALRSRTRGYLSELHRAMCPEESHLSFCSPFSPAEFVAAASNLSSFTASGTYKVANPMLKHLCRSGMDFLHNFSLSWSLHSFPSTWKTSFIIPIHLDSLPPMIWYSGLTALFLFVLAKAALAFLPTNLSVALRPLSLFQQSQYVQVFPLKPAPFCTLFAGLGNTNKSAIFLLLLSDSHSVLTTLSSPPSFLLSQTLWQIWQELSSLSSCYIILQWVPGPPFSPRDRCG